MYSFFATAAKGTEELVATELRGLSAHDVAVQRAGVAFAGSLEVGYRACLWSRVANRILLPLGSFPAATPDELYAGMRGLHWADHLGPRQSLAVDCATSQSALTHSHYGALKAKDAIVDQLREHSGARPSIAVTRPDVRVNLYVHANRAVVSIDLSGDSLHRRAYRQQGVAAPLKETLAAAVLLLADWPRLADAGVPFLDPMCGSGTLPIEAALIAAHIAPGRARAYFGFLGWRGHQAELWRRLQKEADDVALRAPRQLPPIRGYDIDAKSVRAALQNIEHAGLHGKAHIEKRALSQCEPIPSSQTDPMRGLLVTNPPYGERVGPAVGVGSAGPLPFGSLRAAKSDRLLGTQVGLAGLYGELGDVLRRKFTGWTGYVLTGNLALAKRIGLRAARRYTLYNGAIECRLLAFPISSQPVRGDRGPHWRRTGC